MPTRILLCVALMMAGCGGQPEAPTTEAPGGAPRLLVLSSLIGYIEPCGCTIDLTLGGIDRAVALVEAERKKGPTAVLVVGPTFFEHAESKSHLVPQQQAQAKLLARALSKMGVAAYAPGDVAAARDPAVVAQINKALAAPDVTEAGRILTLGGTQVGVLGTRLNDPVAAEAGAAKLRAGGATVVVGLATLPRRDVRRMAKKTPSVNLWVLGDHPQEETTLSPAGDGYLVEAGDRGRNFGRLVLHDANQPGRLADPEGDAARAARALKLKIDMLKMTRMRTKDQTLDAKIKALAAERAAIAQPKHSGKRVEYTLLPIEKSVTPNAEVSAWLKAHNASLAELNLAAAGDVPPVPEGKSGYAGSAECVDCHEEAQAVWAATPHARAWQTLVDAGKTFDAECVSCHVAGWLEPGGATLGKTEKLQNVQCEACHGPGDKHVELGGDENWTRRKVPAAVCETCHNAHHSPKFDYDTYLPKILGPGHEARKD